MQPVFFHAVVIPAEAERRAGTASGDAVSGGPGLGARPFRDDEAEGAAYGLAVSS